MSTNTVDSEKATAPEPGAPRRRASAHPSRAKPASPPAVVCSRTTAFEILGGAWRHSIRLVMGANGGGTNRLGFSVFIQRTVCACELVAALISASVAPVARFTKAITSAFCWRHPPSACLLASWPGPPTLPDLPTP
jgi:hypothetical protein